MTIEELVLARSIDRVQRSPGHAAKLLSEAERHVQAAAFLADIDPVGAYQLAYDASRKAATALLADRGLRPTARDGHVTVVKGRRSPRVGWVRAVGPDATGAEQARVPDRR